MNRRVFVFQVKFGGRGFAFLEVRQVRAGRTQSGAVVASLMSPRNGEKLNWAWGTISRREDRALRGPSPSDS